MAIDCKVTAACQLLWPSASSSVCHFLMFSFSYVLTFPARSPAASQPERPGPAAYLGAQQRDRDGGGEEVPQPQLPQPLPELEHQRQVGQPVWRVTRQPMW